MKLKQKKRREIVFMDNLFPKLYDFQIAFCRSVLMLFALFDVHLKWYTHTHALFYRLSVLIILFKSILATTLLEKLLPWMNTMTGYIGLGPIPATNYKNSHKIIAQSGNDYVDGLRMFIVWFCVESRMHTYTTQVRINSKIDNLRFHFAGIASSVSCDWGDQM